MNQGPRQPKLIVQTTQTPQGTQTTVIRPNQNQAFQPQQPQQRTMIFSQQPPQVVRLNPPPVISGSGVILRNGHNPLHQVHQSGIQKPHHVKHSRTMLPSQANHHVTQPGVRTYTTQGGGHTVTVQPNRGNVTVKRVIHK